MNQTDAKVTSLEDIKVEIRTTHSNANVGKTHQVVLKEGPRAYRIATVFEILNASTREVHHHALRIDAYQRTSLGWQKNVEKGQWIASEPNELNRLVTFVRSVIENQFPSDGTFHIVDANTYKSVEELIQLVQKTDSSAKLRLMQTILADISATPVVSDELTESIGSRERRTSKEYRRCRTDGSISQNLRRTLPTCKQSEYKRIGHSKSSLKKPLAIWERIQRVT